MKSLIKIRDIRGQQKNQTKRTLAEGSKIGVVGGGPAGSFFSYFILDMARRLDLDISVDIYEPKDFSRPGACGCNKCGGIISESLVQLLATEGFTLPSTIVQRGIDSYVMHTDVGNIRIDTPLHEKRIGAVHRGCGPKSIKNTRWESFDGYLLAKAKEKGANVIPEKVEDITWENGIPRIRTSESTNIFRVYDLIAIATGINTSSLKLSENFKIGYTLPKTTKTFICEYYLGEETVAEYLGSSMHVFMLNIPA